MTGGIVSRLMDETDPRSGIRDQLIRLCAMVGASALPPRAEHAPDPDDHGTVATPPINVMTRSASGAFDQLNGRIERPAQFAANFLAFAILIPDSALAPLFQRGDLVFIDPLRRPALEKPVFVQTAAETRIGILDSITKQSFIMKDTMNSKSYTKKKEEIILICEVTYKFNDMMKIFLK